MPAPIGARSRGASRTGSPRRRSLPTRQRLGRSPQTYASRNGPGSRGQRGPQRQPRPRHRRPTRARELRPAERHPPADLALGVGILMGSRGGRHRESPDDRPAYRRPPSRRSLVARAARDLTARSAAARTAGSTSWPDDERVVHLDETFEALEGRVERGSRVPLPQRDLRPERVQSIVDTGRPRGRSPRLEPSRAPGPGLGQVAGADREVGQRQGTSGSS